MEKNQELNMENEVLIANKKIDLDRVLVEEAGQLGRYQLKSLAISVVFIILTLCVMNEFIFTAARVRTRCVIPECENITDVEELKFAHEWLPHAIPAAPDGSGPDSCRRFVPCNTTSKLQQNDSCPAYVFDTNATLPCDAYVYENKYSVVHDFDLACDEWRRSLIGAVRTVGSLVAQPLAGFISDRWGRRAALAFCVLNVSWIGILKTQFTSYVGYLIIGFIETIFGGGTYTCVYILMMEMVGPKYRMMTSATFNSFIAVANSVLVLLAWALPNWKHMVLAIYIPQFLAFFLIWFLPDSIRWCLEKGKFQKATKLLKKMAHTNEKQLSARTIMALEKLIKSEKTQVADEKAHKKTWLVADVLKHKPILIRCLVAPVWWISLTFIYHGMTIYSLNLTAGSKYTNYLVVAFCEVPGFWAAFYLVDRIGRRPVLSGAFCICGLSQLAYILIPQGYTNVPLVLFTVGKCSIASCVTTLYAYTSELFPTSCRHRLVAYCSMVGRIGSIVAPLTPAFGGNIPFLMFGGMGLLAGLLALAMPETLHCKLPDTMEEAADIGRKNNSRNTK